MAFSPDAKTLASGGESEEVRLWNLDTKQQRTPLLGHGGLIGSLAFSPDGRTLAVSSYGIPLKFWDVATGHKRELPAPPPLRDGLAAYSPDGGMLFVDGYTAFPHTKGIICDALTGKERLQLVRPNQSFNTAAFLPTGKSLVATVNQGSVVMHSAASGKLERELPRSSNSWASVAVAPDGRHLVVANGESTVFIFRLYPPDGTAP